MPMPVGRRRACPPRSNGKSRRCLCQSEVISLSNKPSIPSPWASPILLLHWPKCLETSGNGLKVTIPPIRGTPQHRARSGSITANLWPTSLCCAVDRVSPRSHISGQPIGTFSLPMPVGSSWVSGSLERSEGKPHAPQGRLRTSTLFTRPCSSCYRSTNHISMDWMTTLQGPPHNNADATVVKDSHADRSTRQQAIPVL